MERRKTHTIDQLFADLGYADPCPERGQNNKEANRIRATARRPFAEMIQAFRIGSGREYEGDGYFTTPVYEYRGKLYTGADPGQSITSDGTTVVALI